MTRGMTRSGCFVTGTDTGVGKTVVACAILRALRARGVGAAGFKPIETGVGDAGPLDAQALREAAGGDDDLDLVCPQRFALAAAPAVAAAAAGVEVDVAALDAGFRALRARHAFVVAEGAGGLLVPVAVDLTMADLAARWSLPLVVVARASLGTLNHTRLTLEAAAGRGLEVRGLVISHPGGPLSRADALNLAPLLASPGAPLLGVVPPLPPGGKPAPDVIDVGPLLE
jgi:dethiobiotin synthetase